MYNFKNKTIKKNVYFYAVNSGAGGKRFCSYYRANSAEGGGQYFMTINIKNEKVFIFYYLI